MSFINAVLGEQRPALISHHAADINVTTCTRPAFPTASSSLIHRGTASAVRGLRAAGRRAARRPTLLLLVVQANNPARQATEAGKEAAVVRGPPERAPPVLAIMTHTTRCRRP